MMKFTVAVIATMAAVANAQMTAVQENDKKLCDNHCTLEWPEQSVCGEICYEAAVGGVTDCNAGDSDSKDEKYAFWSGCSYGAAVGKDTSCEGVCASLHFTHNLSKFFELTCTHICNSAVKHARNKKPVSCRHHVCGRLWGIEACWRACNTAAGIVEGTAEAEH
jgi:hypothetical protein